MSRAHHFPTHTANNEYSNLLPCLCNTLTVLLQATFINQNSIYFFLTQLL